MTDKSPKSANPTAHSANWSPETLLVHGGTLRSQFGETSEALFLTQSFVYESAEQAEARFKDEDPGFIYSRFSNPTVGMFEERMRLLEGAEAARATATGMAAVTSALLCFLKAGDHIVAARAMFGSCLYVAQELCPRFGIACTLVDGRDTAAWQRAMQPNTRAFFFETPANPTLDLVDIAAVSEIAHAGGALVIVDNVFATPLMQKPLKLGADIVVYSATKHIDGQGRCLGGAVLCSEKFLKDHLHTFLRQTGPALSPFNAWVLLKGLETLPLRVRAQSETAAKIADHLATQPGLKVLYCGRPDYPQAALARRQMSGLRYARHVRGPGRQGGGLPLPQCTKIDQNLEQPGRREEPGHAPGHDHASAAQAGGTGGTRHLRRHAATFGRARGLCRSGGGH